MSPRKTWLEKMKPESQPEVKTVEKDFADLKAGTSMVIGTPTLIEDIIRSIPSGEQRDIRALRAQLASKFEVDGACPVTTGIFLRTVAEANYEKLLAGTAIDELAPFWRAVVPKAPILKKLSFGTDFVNERRTSEGLPPV